MIFNSFIVRLDNLLIDLIYNFEMTKQNLNGFVPYRDRKITSINPKFEIRGVN